MVYGHYYLAREWTKLGHRVTIVAASVAHTRFRQPPTNRAPTAEEEIDGIRYLWVRTPAYAPTSNLGRIVNIFAFTGAIWRRCLPVGRPDVVICSSHYPLAILPAKRLAYRFGARLVFEVRDLWPLTLIELGGASPRNPFIAMMQWAENRAYRISDKVVSVLPYARDYMMLHGMHPAKFIYIPNGVPLHEEAFVPLSSAHALTLKNLRARGRFIVGYAGRIGLANALESAIEGLRRCANPEMHLVILGDGSHRGPLEAYCRARGMSRQVTFLQSVAKPQVIDFLQRIDAAYVGLQKQPLFQFGVSPTKLNDYMLAAKPLICAIDAPVDALEESGAGLLCGGENPASISAAMRKLAEMSPAERQAMGERGRRWITKNRDYRVLAERFLNEAIYTLGDRAANGG